MENIQNIIFLMHETDLCLALTFFTCVHKNMNSYKHPLTENALYP